MAKKKWYLLYKRQDRQGVYIYEPLKYWEFQKKLKKGWKVIK